jgi:hypothetical protein
MSFWDTSQRLLLSYRQKGNLTNSDLKNVEVDSAKLTLLHLLTVKKIPLRLEIAHVNSFAQFNVPILREWLYWSICSSKCSNHCSSDETRQRFPR